jgi:hypothetical protein
VAELEQELELAQAKVIEYLCVQACVQVFIQPVLARLAWLF